MKQINKAISNIFKIKFILKSDLRDIILSSKIIYKLYKTAKIWIMGKFGQVLKKYRELKNISKVKLAKNIGTSDAYLRQIENQGYKPPTFDLCQKISFELSLNELERKELLETAFIERIASEEQFYNFLKKDIFKINKA